MARPTMYVNAAGVADTAPPFTRDFIRQAQARAAAAGAATAAIPKVAPAAPAMGGAAPAAAPAAPAPGPIARIVRGASKAVTRGAAAAAPAARAASPVVKLAKGTGAAALAFEGAKQGINALTGEATPTEVYAKQLGIDQGQVGLSPGKDALIRAAGVPLEVGKNVVMGPIKALASGARALFGEDNYDPNAAPPVTPPVTPPTPAAAAPAALPAPAAEAPGSPISNFVRNNRTGRVTPLQSAGAPAYGGPTTAGEQSMATAAELQARNPIAQLSQRLRVPKLRGDVSLGEAMSGFTDDLQKYAQQRSDTRSPTGDYNRALKAVKGMLDVEKAGMENEAAGLSLRSAEDMRSIYRELTGLNERNDPGGLRRRELVRTALTLAGKEPKPEYEFKNVQGVDPTTGMAVQNLVRVNPNTGQAEAVTPAGQQGGETAGMRQIGTAGGKPVFEDAQGNRFVQE